MLAALMLWAGAPAEGMWVSGYYTGWRQSHLRPEAIDFGALTHVIHFGLYPRPDGTLDSAVNLLSPANVAAAVEAAHGAGRKILVSVGGQATRERFVEAMDERRRSRFIGNIVSFMSENGYDGVDVDMEPIQARDAEVYASFIKELRRRLDRVRPRPLLTASVLWEPELFGRLADKFDQINIMTYNLSGAYPGWVTWHSAALSDGGLRFPNGRTMLPSVEGQVQAFTAAGVPKEKLGIGLSFNGYVWSGGHGAGEGGVNKPGQAWSVPPSVRNLPYYVLADTHGIKEYDYSNPAYRWDTRAQAAYLSIDKPGSADDSFISYENEVSVARKVRFVKEAGLGGMIIWDLGAGYRASQPESMRDALLQSVKLAVSKDISSRRDP